MERKFHGREPEKSGWNWWQLLLYRFFCFWCALDLLFLPILFTVFSQLEKRREEKEENVNEEGSKEAIPDEIGIVQPAHTPLHQLKIKAQI